MARASSPSAHRKPCTLCHTRRDVLIRCQIDTSGVWHMVCPGSCWRSVSGGVDDGDAQHPHYRYGGAWKNKHAGVSAKKPRRVKERQRAQAAAAAAAGGAADANAVGDGVAKSVSDASSRTPSPPSEEQTAALHGD